MPLIHSKTPAAFKKNIKTEIEHGKPPKQAVAIAYSEKREAEHKHSKSKSCMACGGGVCKMSDGGEVPSPSPSPDYDLRDYADDKGISFTNRLNEEAESHSHDPSTTVKIPKSSGYAKGGEVMSHGGGIEGEGGSEGSETLMEDEDLHHAMGEELIGALDKKDKKQIMSAIEAIVLSCMNKGE